MSSVTQELLANRHNPFKLQSSPPKPSASAGSVRFSAGIKRSKAMSQSVQAQDRLMLDAPLPTNSAQKRALRRQHYLQRHQREWQALLRGAFQCLAVGLLFLLLLPSPLQKKLTHHLFTWTAPSPQVSLPPLPLAYDYISSPFGRRWGRQHQGIDFAAAVGEPIYASGAGTVIHAGWEAGYGKSVVIDHGNGMETRYGHCSRLLVKAGEAVPKGGLIAQVGSTGHSTGPHLHFEVIIDGVRKNPAWYYTFTPTPEPSTHLASAQP